MKTVLGRLFVVVVASLFSTAGDAADAPAGADWPGFRGPGRDARVPSLPDTLAAQPKEVWKQKMAGDNHAGIAVAGGLVVVCDASDENDYYRCLDANTGEVKWTREFKNGREMDYGPASRTTPLFCKDKVVVVGAFGEVYCFSLKDGKTVWEKTYAKDFDAGDEPPTWGYTASPLLIGGKVILSPGSRKAGLAAIDPDTGKVLWEGKASGCNYASLISGTFGGVEQIVGIDASSLGGWDPATGNRLWTVKIDPGQGYLCPSPVAVNGKVLVCDAANKAQLFEFAKDGKINPKAVGTNEEVGSETVTPVSSGDLVLAITEGLRCLDAADGLKELWKNEDERALGSDAHLIIAGDKCLAVNTGGSAVLFSFDKAGMKVLGKAKLGKGSLSHPAVVGNRIYVRDKQAIYCFELK